MKIFPTFIKNSFTMVKTKIVYHESDLDGVTSAAIMLLESEYRNEDIDLIPYDYHKDFSQKKTDGHVIYMIDVTLKCSKLFEVAKGSAEFYLVDHHVSFYNNFIKYCEENGVVYEETDFGVAKRYTIKEFNFEYFYSSGYSGCELTMKLFSNNMKDSSRNLVSLLGQYDTWRDVAEKKYSTDQDWDKVVLPVQYALRPYMTPESICKVLYNLDNGGSKYGIDKLILEGTAILSYLKIKNRSDLDEFSFNFEFQGLKLLAMNTSNFTSFTFDSYWNPDLYDAMLAFNFTGKDWRISLYTTKTDIDILKIATFFGGGGHRGACGFRIPHNQIVFRNGKLELGILHVIDIAQIPQSYKGIDVNEIKKVIKEQGVKIINLVDEVKEEINTASFEEVVNEIDEYTPVLFGTKGEDIDDNEFIFEEPKKEIKKVKPKVIRRKK